MGFLGGLLKVGARMLGKVPVIGSTVNKIVSGPLKPVFSVARSIAHTADDFGVPFAHPIAQGMDTMHAISQSAAHHAKAVHQMYKQVAPKVPQYWARARQHYSDMRTQMMRPAKRARLSELGSHPPQTRMQRLGGAVRAAAPYVQQAATHPLVQQAVQNLRQRYLPVPQQTQVQRRGGARLYD